MSNQASSATHHRALAVVIAVLVAIGVARTYSPRARTATPTTDPHDAAVDDAPRVAAHVPRVLDPNTAAAYELESLPAVGPALAARIVAARTRPFRRAEDLLRVRGIGPHTLERMRPLLRFDSPDAGTTDPPSSASRSDP